MSPDDLVKALQARAWYPFAGILLFLLLDLWKRVAPVWGPRIPDGWRWLPPVLVAAIGAFVDAYVAGWSWKLALFMAAYGILSVAGTAMGTQGALKESVLKGWGRWGGPGGASLLLLCALGLLLPVTTACSHDGKGASSAAMVERGAALAFNGAAVALEVLDAREAAYLDSLAKPTEDQLQAARVRVEHLKAAREALAIVRAWLAGEREGDSKAQLRDAVTGLRLVAEELQRLGVNVPSRVTDGLRVAELFAGLS